MSKNGRQREIPVWAQRQRHADLAWIQENHHLLFSTARAQFQEQGRGAIVVDTTIQPLPSAGYPFAYFTQEQVEQMGDTDALRMVRQYNPATEVVIVLLKQFNRVSSYRIRDVAIPASVEQN